MTGWGDLQGDAAAILSVVVTANQAGFFTALAEFDDGMVPEAEPFGYVRYGRLREVGGSGDVEQELVLLGMKAVVSGTGFAEMEELTEGVSELG